MVDPKTVVLKPKTSGNMPGPKPAVGLTPGVYNYKVKLQLGGQSMDMTQKTEVVKNADGVRIGSVPLVPSAAADAQGPPSSIH